MTVQEELRGLKPIPETTKCEDTATVFTQRFEELRIDIGEFFGRHSWEAEEAFKFYCIIHQKTLCWDV